MLCVTSLATLFPQNMIENLVSLYCNAIQKLRWDMCNLRICLTLCIEYILVSLGYFDQLKNARFGLKFSTMYNYKIWNEKYNLIFESVQTYAVQNINYLIQNYYLLSWDQCLLHLGQCCL